LLVGDIVKITEGMVLPADGVVIDAKDVTCDESALTGEPDMLKKAHHAHCCHIRDRLRAQAGEDHFWVEGDHHLIPSAVLLSGTKVQTGEGLFVVVMVGANSCVGKINSFVSEEVHETPL